MRIHLCTIGNCTRRQTARGWCENHYRRWRRHGSPLGGKHYRTTCTVDDCTNAHSAKGYCALHYQRVVHHGDPLYVTFRDVDDVAVLRAVTGDRPAQMSAAEREAAVRRLHEQGLTDRLIGERVGLGASGVWTVRQRLGLPANTVTPLGDFSGRVAA